MAEDVAKVGGPTKGHTEANVKYDADLEKKASEDLRHQLTKLRDEMTPDEVAQVKVRVKIVLFYIQGAYKQPPL